MDAPWISGDPVLGAFREFKADPLGFLTRASRLGDVVGFRLGRTTFHLVSHPEGVQWVLVDNAANYRKTGPGQDLVRLAFGDGMPTSEGERWRGQRRTTAPAFRHDRIGALVPLMADAAAALADEWSARGARGESLEIGESLARATLAIAGRAMFGSDLGDRAGAVDRALATIREEVSHRSTSLGHALLGTSLPTPRNLRFRAAIRDLRAVAAAMIADRRSAAVDGDDLLSILLGAERAEEAGDAPLLDQVVPLLIASHLTTSNALTWTFHLLSTHRDAEERARAEVRAALAGRTPRLDDVEHLPFVRAAIDEALRLYPPGWRLTRWVDRDDEILGVAIARGTCVFVSPWTTQRHPAWWPQPERFDPTRFLGPPGERPRLAYFPFGAGIRQCVGSRFALLEATTVLATILQRVRLEPSPGQVVEPAPLMTLSPRHGVHMRPVPL